MAPVSPLMLNEQLGKMRELLRLIAAFWNIRDPLTSPEGLRQAIALLFDLAVFLGLDEEFIARLGSILEDEQVFRVVLAVAQYLAGLLRLEKNHEGMFHLACTTADGGETIEVDARGFLDWPPIVLQLIELIRRLRGEF